MAKQQRLIELLDRLQGDKPLRWMVAELNISSQSTLHRWKTTGIIATDGKLAIAKYLGRDVEDLEAYLSERYSLDELLDPKKRFQHLSHLTKSDIMHWLHWHATLQEKVEISEALNSSIHSMLLDSKAKALRDSIEGIIKAGRYKTTKEIADTIGLPVERLDDLMSGKLSPSEADLIALSGVLNGEIEMLTQFYLTGS